MQKTVLIVANQPSNNTRRLAEAVVRGATNDRIEGVAIVYREPLAATPEDVLNCQGIVLGTTENFGYMSGALKDFFERIYYPCLEKTQGLPYGLYVKGGNDGTGAQTSVERIVAGLRWSAIQPCILLTGDYNSSFDDQCEELGMLMAAGLDAGVF